MTERDLIAERKEKRDRHAVDAQVRYGHGIDLCTCDDCCKAQPARLELRRIKEASFKTRRA